MEQLGFWSGNRPMSDAALWAEILAMFLGRFEIIILMITLIKVGKDGWAGMPLFYSSIIFVP